MGGHQLLEAVEQHVNEDTRTVTKKTCLDVMEEKSAIPPAFICRLSTAMMWVDYTLFCFKVAIVSAKICSCYFLEWKVFLVRGETFRLQVRWMFNCCIYRKDPVVLLETGHTYDRIHIHKWLESNQTCPVTERPLQVSLNLNICKLLWSDFPYLREPFPWDFSGTIWCADVADLGFESRLLTPL